jgi:hypothetical protein
MQGPMMPLKWGSDRQTKIAKQLGFDAEDPMIKMEMSQILSKGAQARRAREPNEVEELLADYQRPKPSEKTTDAEVSQDPAGSTPTSSRSVVYVVLASLLVLVLATGIFILIRARSQN